MKDSITLMQKVAGSLAIEVLIKKMDALSQDINPKSTQELLGKLAEIATDLTPFLSNINITNRNQSKALIQLVWLKQACASLAQQLRKQQSDAEINNLEDAAPIPLEKILPFPATLPEKFKINERHQNLLSIYATLQGKTIRILETRINDIESNRRAFEAKVSAANRLPSDGLKKLSAIIMIIAAIAFTPTIIIDVLYFGDKEQFAPLLIPAIVLTILTVLPFLFYILPAGLSLTACLYSIHHEVNLRIEEQRIENAANSFKESLIKFDSKLADAVFINNDGSLSVADINVSECIENVLLNLPFEKERITVENSTETSFLLGQGKKRNFELRPITSSLAPS